MLWVEKGRVCGEWLCGGLTGLPPGLPERGGDGGVSLHGPLQPLAVGRRPEPPTLHLRLQQPHPAGDAQAHHQPLAKQNCN